MNFGQLRANIIEHAEIISKQSTPSSKYRASNYKKVAKIIEQETKLNSLATSDRINYLPITQHMKFKLIDMIGEKNNRLDNKLSGRSTENLPIGKVKGIGQARSASLTTMGVRTMADLNKLKPILSKETVAYLELNPVAKIPHEYIRKFETILKKIKSMRMTLVGSYRRKKPFSSDVDIMITSNNPDIIDIFRDKIQSIFETRVYSQGPDRISMIIISDITFKIDAFRTTVEGEIPMLIYATGSKEFNIFMRATAKRKGYLLNQKGLFKDGKQIKLKKEEDYFKILGIKYVKPELR
jgi:DNA polymerase/3'-5' exonuclease PolX